MLQYTVIENTVVKYNKNRDEYYTIPMYSVNAIEIQFILDDSWKDYVITAQISNGEKTYNLLLENNTAFIPADITEGLWNVSIFGVKGEEKRNTTIPSNFIVVNEGFKNDGQPAIPPEPDLYQKLLVEIQKGIDIAQSVKDDADAGSFDGNGIKEIKLINKVDKVANYKIIFTNGTEFDYQITDGTDGINGVDGVGIKKIEFVEKIDKTAKYKITLTNGNYFEYEILDGENGKDGITPEITVNATVNNNTGTPNVSIEKTGTAENPIFNLSFQNLKGEKGADGQNGADGIDGKSATITIGTVTTVSPDTPASVTNTGTDTDAIFNFEIPKGADGSGASIDYTEVEKLAIKTTIEGNPAMSSSSAEWRVPLIEGYGQSTQVTATGAQLLNPLDVKKGLLTDIMGTVSVSGTNGQLYRTIFLNLKQGNYNFNIKSGIKTLTIVRNVKNGELDQSFTSIAENGYTFSPEENGVFGISFRFNDKSEFTDEELYMLNSGSISLDYEPYTGGAPSPSPEYPQEIKSSVVTGVKVMGKNLFDISALEKDGSFDVEENKITFIKKTANNSLIILDNVAFWEAAILKSPIKKIIIHCEGLGSSVNLIAIEIMAFTDDSPTITKRFYMSTGGNGSVKPLNAVDVSSLTKIQSCRLIVSYKNGEIDYPNGWAKGIMVEFNEDPKNPSPYEFFKLREYRLSAPVTLRGIPSESGNVTIDGQKHLSDYIGQKDGVYGVLRKIQSIMLTGDRTWGASQSGDLTYRFSQTGNFVNQAVGYCDKLPWVTIGLSVDKELIGISSNIIYVRVKKERLFDGTSSSFKNWISENPLKIITVANEETFEPLPEADQQALKDLKTFYPTSIISWETEDGTGAWTRVEIIHDPTNYIDEKLAEITAQQTALQADILKIGGSI